MRLIAILTLNYLAPPGLQHSVVVSNGGSTVEVFLDSNNPIRTVSDDLYGGSLPLQSDGPPITVSAGSLGCPGPVRVKLFASHSQWDWAPEILISTAIFLGTGQLVLERDVVSKAGRDRGYDYYVTLHKQELGMVVHPSFSITGANHTNFLATWPRDRVFTAPTPGRFIEDTDMGSSRRLVFGINDADLPGLNNMFVGTRGGSSIPHIGISVSKQFLGSSVVVFSGDVVPTIGPDGQEAALIQLDWVGLVNAVFSHAAPPPAHRRNILTKRIDATFIPGSPGVMGSPGRPATPATTTFVQEQVCTWGPDPAAMARQGWTLGPVDNNPASPTFGTRLWLPPGVGQASSNWQTTGFGTGWGGRGGAAGASIRAEIPYATTCRLVNRPVHTPAQPAIPPVLAVPAIPSQTIREFNTGWTGRVRSTRSFVGEGRAQFRAPRNLIGAVVGLSSSFHSSGVGGVHYAFRLENGTARAIDQAGLVTNLGVYNDNDLFEIRRFGGQITYRINDVVMHSVPNTGAPLYLNAVLFSGGDSIHNPVIGGFTRSNVSLMPLTSSASGMQFFLAAPPAGSTTPGALQPLHSWGWGSTQRGAISTVSLRPLEVRSRTNVRSHTALRALTALGSNRTYGAAVASLLPIVVAGEGGLGVPTYAISATMIGFLASSGRILNGGVLTGGESLRPLFGLASDRVYGAGAFALAPLTSWGAVKSAAEMLDASVISPLLASGGTDISGELAVVMTSTGHVSGLLNFLVVSNAEAVSEGTISMNHVLNAVLSARAISAVTAASIGAPPQTFVRVGQGGTSETRPTASVWVVNARNSATSRYEDFQFNSFAKIGDRYYGAKDGGIYALDGKTDNGVNIEAMVALGKHNFDTGSQLMRLENCYMGLASDGKMVLKVISEGREYIYRTRGSSTELQTQRVDIGRGIRANFMGFEVWNANGGDFDIQNIEFTAVVLNRRI